MFDQLIRFVKRSVAAYQESQAFTAARAELKRMSDTQLMDLGIRRDQIDDYLAGWRNSAKATATPMRPRKAKPVLRLVVDQATAEKSRKGPPDLCCPDRQAA